MNFSYPDPKIRRRPLLRLWYAFNFSLAGLKAAWSGEPAFRQEILLLLILGPTGYWLAETGAERALLIGSLFLVLIIELCNSAIEAVVDRWGPECHPLAGRAKDLGSAAVLLALVQALLVWLLVLLP